MVMEDHKSISNIDPAYWFALLRTPVFQRRSLTRLLETFIHPEDIFRAGPRALSGFGLSAKALEYLEHPDWPAVVSDMEWLAKPGNHLITIRDDAYPVLLKEIHDPPPALHLSGDPAVLNHTQISIVGSRRPSPDGRRIARKFARGLANLGITITSGLAMGLDSEAHKGALQAGMKTVAVLGNGLDFIYPAWNRELAASITANGAVISEFPLGSRPLRTNFPLRNRIISGLSVGTIVVEAALKSGSLITARCAMEQGREVFAVPGSIYNTTSHGCHYLIREGAKLIECIDDVLEEIRPLSALLTRENRLPEENDKKIKMLDADCKLLLDNIGKRPVTIDILVEETGLPVNSVASALLALEMEGLIDSLPGGEYTRR